MKRISKLNTRQEIIAAWMEDSHIENLDKPTCPSCRDILFHHKLERLYFCRNNECKVNAIRTD